MEAFNMLALLFAICLILDYLINKGGESNRKIQKRDIHLSVSSGSPEPDGGTEIQRR